MNSKLIVFSLFIFIQPQSIFMDCNLSLGGISCICSNTTLLCMGIQKIDEDFMPAILNTSVFHLENLIIDVENLSLGNFTFEKLEVKNLSLSSGISTLNNNLFADIADFIISLDLQRNNFSKIPSNALHILRNLEHLDMSSNVITSLSKTDFEGLENLKYLSLKSNLIEIIHDEAFTHLRNLEWLYLDSNKITKLEIVVFDNLYHLEILSLSTNYLQKFEPETFTELSSLRKLDISHNNFTFLENINFSSKSLIELSAVNCSLQGAVENNDLNLLLNLESLDLSFNHLTLVGSFALSSLQTLRSLNMSYNVIRELEHNAFANLVNLKELDLKNNVLFVVRINAFHNLTKLVSLNLNTNRLGAFLCDYTSDLFSLEEIDLRNNQLKTIQPGTFIYSNSLEDIKLHGNILDCTCSISEFAMYLLNNTNLNKVDLFSITCSSPAAFIGIPIINVNYNNMTCPVSTICSSPTLAVTDDEDHEKTTDFFSSTTKTSSSDSYFKSTSDDITTLSQISANTTISKSTVSLVTNGDATTNTVSAVNNSVEITSVDYDLTSATISSLYNHDFNHTTDFTLAVSTQSKSASVSSTSITNNTAVSSTEFNDFTQTSDTVPSSPLSTNVFDFSNERNADIIELSTAPITENGIEIFFKNHTYVDGVLCLEWMMNGTMPSERLQCILLYTYPNPSLPSHHENHKKARFHCPNMSNEVKQECLKIFKVDILYQFCIQIYKQSTKELLSDSCIIHSKKTSIETSTTKISTEITNDSLSVVPFSVTSSHITTIRTEPTADSSETSEVISNKIIPPSSTVMTTTTTKPSLTAKTALKFKSPLNPFNFSYINFAFMNDTTLFVEWRVNKKEPPFACHLMLSIFNDNSNHTELPLPCKDGSHTVVGLEKHEEYKLCLTAFHVTYGIIPLCSYVYSPSLEFSSSSSNSEPSFSSLPTIVLIALLVVIILFAALLAARNILRKSALADRYNVSTEEKKVQRRENLKKSNTHSVRYSYTVNEDV